MDSFVEGSVVICSTSQAGTLVQLAKGDIWVLLRNGDIFTGSVHEIRFPQDDQDLQACPIDVEHQEVKRSARSD